MTDTASLLEQAGKLDRSDPLAPFKARFALPSENLIYLDGNSLGPLPEATAALIGKCIVQDWGEGLIRSWNTGWYDLPVRLGDLLAPLLGAQPGEVCFADSVTVNLFKLASAALHGLDGRRSIVTDDLNFPSDYYVLEQLIKLLGNRHTLDRVASGDGMTVSSDSLVSAIGDQTALISLSHVVFKSGFMHQLAPICEAARRNGAMTLIDLSHSVGSVPIELNRWGVDMAVGCSYKYLNGGPGAPAFLFVRKGLQEKLLPQLAGWFGSRHPFQFEPHYSPARGIRRFLAGTPPILSLQAIEMGILLLMEAGMESLRQKSIRQSQFFIELFDRLLQPVGFQLGSPRDPARRGSHLALTHREAFRINKALISPPEGKPVVIPDFRVPDNLRIGLAPLFLGYTDVFRAAMRMREIVIDHEYMLFDHETETVT